MKTHLLRRIPLMLFGCMLLLSCIVVAAPHAYTDTYTLKQGTSSLKSVNDSDLKGSSFAALQLRGVAKNTKQISLSWKKIKGASKYVVYGNLCGKSKKYLKLKTLGASKYSYMVSKVKKVALKKGKSYKFFVAAFNKSGKAIAISKTVHVRTKGGAFGNYTGVKITAPATRQLELTEGETYTLKAQATKTAQKVSVHRKLQFESSNPKVATIGAKSGKIKAVGKGSCYIYVYNQSGQFKKLKLTVLKKKGVAHYETHAFCGYCGLDFTAAGTNGGAHVDSFSDLDEGDKHFMGGTVYRDVYVGTW